MRQQRDDVAIWHWVFAVSVERIRRVRQHHTLIMMPAFCTQIVNNRNPRAHMVMDTAAWFFFNASLRYSTYACLSYCEVCISSSWLYRHSSSSYAAPPDPSPPPLQSRLSRLRACCVYCIYNEVCRGQAMLVAVEQGLKQGPEAWGAVSAVHVSF